MAHVQRLFTLLALLACAVSASAKVACDGLATQARYRYIFLNQLPDPSQVKTAEALVSKWWQEDCPGALAHGQGTALGTGTPNYWSWPSAFSTVQSANYVAWSDWASLDDLKRCFVNGLKSGNMATLRKWNTKAIRMVLKLENSTTTTCKQGSTATVRLIFLDRLVKPELCNQANALQKQITSAEGVAVGHGESCDAGSDKVYGKNTMKTANFGGYIDFTNLGDLKAYLSKKSPGLMLHRTQLRSLYADSMHIVMAL